MERSMDKSMDMQRYADSFNAKMAEERTKAEAKEAEDAKVRQYREIDPSSLQGDASSGEEKLELDTDADWRKKRAA